MSAFFSEVFRWDFDKCSVWLYLITQLSKNWNSEFQAHKNRPWAIFAGIFNVVRLIGFHSHHRHTGRAKLYCLDETRLRLGSVSIQSKLPWWQSRNDQKRSAQNCEQINFENYIIMKWNILYLWYIKCTFKFFLILFR